MRYEARREGTIHVGKSLPRDGTFDGCSCQKHNVYIVVHFGILREVTIKFFGSTSRSGQLLSCIVLRRITLGDGSALNAVVQLPDTHSCSLYGEVFLAGQPS